MNESSLTCQGSKICASKMPYNSIMLGLKASKSFINDLATLKFMKKCFILQARIKPKYGVIKIFREYILQLKV